MKIIDFRFRPNTPEIVAGIANSNMFKEMCLAINFSENMKGQPLEEVVAELDAHKVELAVITGRDCETTYQTKPNNENVLEFVNKYPHKFIGFFGVDPHKGMRGTEQLKHAVNVLGFKGAAIDPYLAQIYVHDAKYYPIYAKCCELDVPIIITTGPAMLVPNAIMDHVAPKYIDFVAKDFPELKIVISHGGYPWVNEVIALVQRHTNVYLELSEYENYPQSEAYIQAANTIIGDKILYASAHPFVDFEDALKTYEALPFTDDVRQKIMYKNAAKLLKLQDRFLGSDVDVKSNSSQQQDMEKIIIESVLKELSKRGVRMG